MRVARLLDRAISRRMFRFTQRCRWNEFRAFSSNFDIDMEDDDPPLDKTEQKLKILAEKREELKKKTGRLWTDPLDIMDMLESGETYDTMADHSPDLVSRITQERLQFYEKDGSKIPLLHDLAELPLPPGPLPHPGDPRNMKMYALLRKRDHYNRVAKRVEELAKPMVTVIQALTDWQDKQDAVDVMYEDIEFTLKEEMKILGLQPQFGKWVEKALENYLRKVAKYGIESKSAESDNPTDKTADATDATEDKIRDEDAVPIFMDCYNPEDGEQTLTMDENNIFTIPKVVPSILHPLRQHHRGKPSVARMVEEWELAALKTTKRMMLRQSTRKIARALVEAEKKSTAARVLVYGRQGSGKSAALAAIVASARLSGCLVLYLVEGDILSVNGYYIEPNYHRKGIWDLPWLTRDTCTDFLLSHRDDLDGLYAEESALGEFFSNEELAEYKKIKPEDFTSVRNLLEGGAEIMELAPMCYSAAIDALMKQDKKPFLIVADEYNCYHRVPGHYHHGEYDNDQVRKSIPYDEISLFKPFMDAVAVPSLTDQDFKIEKPPVVMKRGGVVVATTESHAILRQTTDGLIDNAREMERRADNENLTVVEVPRLTKLEAEHMLSNYESIGIGVLRLDRGETVMNANEVEYYRCVAGGEAQSLMNAVIIQF